MKKLVLIAMVAMVSIGAQARTTICGNLSSVTTGPKCEAGQMCPHFIRVVEILTKTSGEQIELQTKSARVLKTLSSLNGSLVCADGTPLNDAQFEVKAVRKAKSAF